MARDDVWTLRNEGTGEVGFLRPETIRPSAPTRKHPYHQRGRFAWYVVNSDEYATVIRTMRGAAVHVFTALPLVMGKDNVLLCGQGAIAEATGLAIPTVSLALKEMRRQLIVGPVQGVPRFSPEIAWKGHADDLEYMRKLWREAKLGWIAERKGAAALDADRSVNPAA